MNENLGEDEGEDWEQRQNRNEKVNHRNEKVYKYTKSIALKYACVLTFEKTSITASTGNIVRISSCAMI
jgi:hypothetical protein